MAGFQVRALYDFQGQPGTGELTIVAEDILNVTRTDVGEGWWEGTNSRGETGLFPAAYVEALASAPPPSCPPPPLPAGYDGFDSNNIGVNNYEQQQQSVSCPSSPHTNYPHQGYDAGDDWDDEWDDDDSIPPDQTNNQAHQGGFALSLPSRDIKSSSTGDVSSIGKGDGGGKGTVKKNINRFSTFVKSGGEAFILGQLKIFVPDSEKFHIIETSEGIVWSPNPNPYLCAIASPKKESKLKGLKSFIAYQITPSFNNIQVSRRYKHFDWLHQRLEEKFTLIPVPPLPDKQISGRYEEQFIEHRMAQLQSWVNRITRHPVLSQCEVWKHFLTCTDEKKWKAGKRRAEKDELVAASFFMAVQPPAEPLDLLEVESQTENFGKFVKTMDDAVKQLQVTVMDQVKKHIGPYKRECQKISISFKSLASAFELDPSAKSQKLTAAIRQTGNTYEEIGKLYEEQPKFDLEVVGDVVHEYKGMLAAFPDILTVHKGAIQKRKEYEKLRQEGRMDNNQVEDVCQRTDIVSYTTLAEINHFQQERVTDFKMMMITYLQEQITFYQKIVGQLEESLNQYNYA